MPQVFDNRRNPAVREGFPRDGHGHAVERERLAAETTGGMDGPQPDAPLGPAELANAMFGWLDGEPPAPEPPTAETPDPEAPPPDEVDLAPPEPPAPPDEFDLDEPGDDWHDPGVSRWGLAAVVVVVVTIAAAVFAFWPDGSEPSAEVTAGGDVHQSRHAFDQRG